MVVVFNILLINMHMKTLSQHNVATIVNFLANTAGTLLIGDGSCKDYYACYEMTCEFFLKQSLFRL